MFSNPWLWVGGFGLLVALSGSLFLVRMRRGKPRLHHGRIQTIQRIERFTDENL